MKHIILQNNKADFVYITIMAELLCFIFYSFISYLISSSQIADQDTEVKTEYESTRLPRATTKKKKGTKCVV